MMLLLAATRLTIMDVLLGKIQIELSYIDSKREKYDRDVEEII
jgi:hypothetical protein